MQQTNGTLLIPCDIGARWGRKQQIDALKGHLEQRLNQPVVVPDSQTDLADSVTESIRSLVRSGIDRIVVLPLGSLSASNHADFADSLAWAIHESGTLRLHIAPPLTTAEWTGWLRATALDALAGLAMRPQDAAVLLVGECDTPAANADLARQAHLLLEGSKLARVPYAFLEGTRPTVTDALTDLAKTGFQQIIVLPWLLEEESRFQRLRAEIVAATHTLGLSASLTEPSLTHPALINLLVSNHCTALSDDAVRIPSGSSATLSKSVEVPGSLSPAPAVTPADFIELQALQHRINSLLPPEYQGRYETVGLRSMGTARLKFDSEGKVAWGEIWTSFCDLALAGGPPHRGTLLEAVTTDEALADPEASQKVVEEIERGVRLVTGLPVVASRSPGWVGVRCESEEMAVWLMRAIIVENVMVRREGDTIYLPAGPRFRVEREIKNVITTIAKTVHYWTAHLTARQRPS